MIESLSRAEGEIFVQPRCWCLKFGGSRDSNCWTARVTVRVTTRITISDKWKLEVPVLAFAASRGTGQEVHRKVQVQGMHVPFRVDTL